MILEGVSSRITSFAQGLYTVTMSDDDVQTFASFPDPDVRPVPPVVFQDDDDCVQGRAALCRHLLHWLWLLQGVLRHAGGMELTAEEIVGPGSWLDLMCALRVEPNVVNAPAAAYDPNPPMVGMGTSVGAAVEECVRLLLLRVGREGKCLSAHGISRPAKVHA